MLAAAASCWSLWELDALPAVRGLHLQLSGAVPGGLHRWPYAIVTATLCGGNVVMRTQGKWQVLFLIQ